MFKPYGKFERVEAAIVEAKRGPASHSEIYILKMGCHSLTLADKLNESV